MNRCLSAWISHECDLTKVFCIPPSCIYTWTQLINLWELRSKSSRKCISGKVSSTMPVTQSEWWEDSLETALPQALITICTNFSISLSAETNSIWAPPSAGGLGAVRVSGQMSWEPGCSYYRQQMENTPDSMQCHVKGLKHNFSTLWRG